MSHMQLNTNTHSLRFQQYSVRNLLSLVVTAMIGVAGTVNAQEVVRAQENVKQKIEIKAGTLKIKTGDEVSTIGVGLTTFKFHPRDFQVTHFAKVLGQRPTILPAAVTHTYQGNEEHSTAGHIDYNMGIAKTPKGYSVSGKYSGTITPGTSNPQRGVSITATFLDPFTFSDTDPTSSFEYAPEGLDMAPALGAGTAFPDVWSDGSTGGALADGTGMLFRARVSPGVVGDPQEFWADGLSGAIDLYSLQITSDEDQNVNASLEFGESTAGFTLDYRNMWGNSFDPTDSVAIDAMELFIEESFTNGVVLVDTSDLFTVGFVPVSGFTEHEYTAGFANVLDIAALEVPAPGTAALLSLSGLIACSRRRR